MAPRLVFVHGIGKQRRQEADAACWLSALADGAREAGHATAAASLVAGALADVVFADYSHLFKKPGGQGTGDVMVDDDQARLLVGLLAEIIETCKDAAEGSATDASLARALAQLRPAGSAQGAGDLVRRAINAATTFMDAGPWKHAGQWVSGRFLVRDLAQVARYLSRGEPDTSQRTLDRRIRGVVTQAFGPGPTVIVAHSLGTVVAFEALHEYTAPVPLWITLGSPLAMRAVVWPRIIPRPPGTPEMVTQWRNYWDRDDVIVPRPVLESDFAPNARGVIPKSKRVDSDGIWVHTATKYLAKGEVAGRVIEALQRGGRADG